MHLELLSHTDFLARYRLRDPLVMLRQLCIKMIDRIQTRNLTLDSHDILLTGSTDQASAHLIRERAKIKGPSPRCLPPPHFQCSRCGGCFGALVSHLRSGHRSTRPWFEFSARQVFSDLRATFVVSYSFIRP